MSLDEIILPTSVQSILYPHQLILLEKEKKNVEKKTTEPIKFLGGNNKKIVFIINNSDQAYLSDDEMKTLEKMLAACKLTLADIAIINYPTFPELDFESIYTALQPVKCIGFGINAAQLSIDKNFRPFEVDKIKNVQFVFAPDFGALIKNEQQKRNLWQSLQKLFSL